MATRFGVTFITTTCLVLPFLHSSGILDQTPGIAGSDANKLCDQGLVVNGHPNLKLFNQLYWTITFAFVAVGHVVFPLPHLVSGTFPAESRSLNPETFPSCSIPGGDESACSETSAETLN